MAEIPFTFVVKGKYWFFRRAGVQTRLPGVPGDREFHARYDELKTLTEPPAAAKQDTSSFRWLIARYRASAEFGALAAPTQDDYEGTLELIGRELGDEPFRLTTRAMIKAVRDDLAVTPRKAHKVKQMVSRLYSWADEAEMVPEGFNPAAKIRRLKNRPTPITPWSEEEIALFLSQCPGFLETPVLLALYTGQRREDLVRMDWSAFQGSFIRVRQSKTGEPLDIACHRDLRKHLAAVRTKFGGTIARTAKGRPFTANSLSQAVRRAVECTDGMPKDRSLHGIRYAAASRLDEAGCSAVQCAAVLGHRTYQMAMKYMAQRAASRAAVTKQEQTG
jgi:integrase